MFLMHEKITAGLGQAGYFLSREGYRHQFPGAYGLPAIPLRGCRCYSIKINGLDAVAIRPEQSRHPPEMIEIIAQVYLCLALMPTEMVLASPALPSAVQAIVTVAAVEGVMISQMVDFMGKI